MNRSLRRFRAAASACGHVLVAVCLTLMAASIVEHGQASGPAALSPIDVSLSVADPDLSPGGLDGDYEGAVSESCAPAPDEGSDRATAAAGSQLTRPLVLPDIPPELVS